MFKGIIILRKLLKSLSLQLVFISRSQLFIFSIDLSLIYLVMVVIKIDFQVLSKVEIILLVAKARHFLLILPNQFIGLLHVISLSAASALFQVLIRLLKRHKLSVLKSDEPHHRESNHSNYCNQALQSPLLALLMIHVGPPKRSWVTLCWDHLHRLVSFLHKVIYVVDVLALSLSYKQRPS